MRQSSLLPPFRTHGDGPPLLLISGLGSKGTSWRPFLQLAARHHRVVTVDCRGAHDTLRQLRRLALPALVIAGGDDRLMPARHAEALAKAIPGAQLAVIPGAGHLVHLEAADAFAREVMRFLAAGGPT